MFDMTRSTATAVSLLMLAALFDAASAQTQQQVETCGGKGAYSAAIRIKACTAVLEGQRSTAMERAFALRNRGPEYRNLKDYNRALADLDESIRLDPNSFEAYFLRGSVYDDLKNYDHAIADYSKAIELSPGLWLYFLARGTAYKNKKMYDQAIADFGEAIRLYPMSVLAMNSRGEIYLQLGQNDRAIADFNAAIRLDKNDALALYNRGIAKKTKGDIAGGDADIARAKTINPKIGQ